MPTTYTDQFFVMDPGNPPAGGTALTRQTFDFIDSNDDGFIGTGAGDTFNGLTITSVWVGDTITVNIPGQGNVTITGVTFYVSGGPAVFTPTDGTFLEDATFVSSTFVNTSTRVPVATLDPICFAAGTMIATPDGPRAVESLRPGDLVLTLDDGAQPVLLVSRQSFVAKGRNAPVRICRGALGNARDLYVSQQHRMLIGDWRAELYCGAPEVLVAAKHLVNGDTIHLAPGGRIDYVHLLFARHQLVWAEGILSESYFPGHFIDRTSEDQRAEIERMFPEAVECAAMLSGPTARPVLRGSDAAVFCAGSP